jgi:DNA gyrase/topoisomerase IV subunit A
MRYTGCRLSKTTKNLAFKLIKYVPWQLGELDEKEPLFLPTMFPLCLLGEEYTQGIGFGYKTFIPCFRIEDLYKRLLFLLGQRKTKPIIKPISDCAIVSSDKEIESLLLTGKASISVKGVSIAHPKDHSVILRSWPPGRKFESLLNRFAEERENNDIGFQDLSTEETYIVFKVLKQRNKDAIYNKFVKKLDKVLTGNIPFEMIVVDSNRQVRVASVDELLLGSHKMFLNSNVAMLESEISRYQNIRKEYLVLQAIRPILSEHLKEEIKDVKLVIDDICKRTDLSKKMVTSLFAKYRINKLLSLSIDIDEINQEVTNLKANLGNAFQFSLDQYAEVMNGKQKK